MLTRMHILQIGRDAVTGRFIPVARARSRPSTTTVEVIRHRRRRVPTRTYAKKRRYSPR